MGIYCGDRIFITADVIATVDHHSDHRTFLLPTE